jgi:AraC-like DNA-binding protein
MKSQFLPFHNTSLQKDVIVMWQFEGRPTFRQQTILPQGICEIIFSFSDTVNYRFSTNEQNGISPRYFITGLTTKPITLTLPDHQVFFGVVFFPHALKKILRVPPGNFLNKLTDLSLLNKTMDEIWHRMAEAENFEKRTEILRCWIEKNNRDTYVQEMIFSSYLKNSLPAISVSDLAGRLCYSVRQLHRKSNELFGMSTEALIHYKRYLCSLNLLHREYHSLTDVANQSGFYDQSHFIRHFREYTGLTPGEYLKQKSHMTAHLFS